MLIDNQPWWTGGYTYLHRPVPIYFNLNHRESANYLIGNQDRIPPPGFSKIYENGKYALFHRPGTCVPDPGYRGWLN